eukprot:Nk52_evm56s217 gene=Nk52_evmTU56s217
MPSSGAVPQAPLRFKVVLLGEGCVGKTSLILRYCQNVFNENHVTTLQAAFIEKRVNLQGKRVVMAIWDTAGQERFHALGPIYYRDSNGAILVYDVTDRDSYSRVQKWVKELRTMLGDNVVLKIVGNKIDLLSSSRSGARGQQSCVSKEEAERYAESVGATHSYTSAKINNGIEEMFLDVTKTMVGKFSSEGVSTRGAESMRGSRTLIVSEESNKTGKENSRNCC